MTPTQFATSLLIDMRREVLRAYKAKGREQSDILHGLIYRIDQAIIHLSAGSGVVLPLTRKQGG